MTARTHGYQHRWHDAVSYPQSSSLLQVGSEVPSDQSVAELVTRDDEHMPLEQALEEAMASGAVTAVPRYGSPGGVPGAQSLLDLYAEGVRMPGYGASPMEVEAAHDEAEARRRVLADADGASHLAAALSTSGRSM